ncbi:MAG: glycosyltransferase family 4 protein [Spirochaetales bacterium]|nr:glycosyltransferase family 4 protein [Spirochaetales bacterium]
MKILFIITRGDLVGGAQIHVRDMSIALRAAGHHPWVLVGSAGDFTRQLAEADIGWELVPNLKRQIHPIHDIIAIGNIRKAIRRHNPDLVSTHTAKAGMVGRIAAVLEKRPVLFTAHGWQFADGIPLSQALPVLWIERFLSPLTRRIITVSEYDYTLALRKKAAPEKRMAVIHNGLPDVRTASRPKEETSGHTPRLVMIARFQPQKDHLTLLRALKQIFEPDWELDLVSDGPDLEIIKGEVKSVGLEKKVHFLGQRSDIEEILGGSDIFVLASHWEGFPRSIIEAMRASLPVVCTDVGGCRESVVHGKTGFLVKEKDEQDLAQAIRTLLQDPETARTMGQAGRKRYEEYFTFKIMFYKTLEVYKEVTGL